MTAADLMTQIEGDRFSALVNLASDFKTFLRILGDQPAVQALSLAVADDAIAHDVGKRVSELAAYPGGNGLEHPADAALAAYLWVLASNRPRLGESAAAAVRPCERCWWSRKMAEYISDPARFRPVAARVGAVSPVTPGTVPQGS